MDAVRRNTFSDDQGESQPLMRPMSSANVGSLCFVTMLAGLAFVWCVVDRWNRSVSGTLFGLGDLEAATLNTTLAQEGIMAIRTYKPFPTFNYPLFLAFVQFAFMGLIFLALFWVLFRDASSFSWVEVSHGLVSDWRWPALVVTHIFSIFWLQSLMMPVPAQALSLGLFAATRAAEIPATALLRAPIVGAQLGMKTAKTTALACAAAATLYCAYAQVSGCLCVWSGHGITLLGPAFWIVYILVLLVPATNLVLQEGVMQWNGMQSMHPVLMLSVMNLCACIVFVPVLLIAHNAGWEDVSEAFAMTMQFSEASLLVVWLAFQMSIVSLITVAIILMTDSFWAVSLRALRVVYWWVTQLWWLYARAALSGVNVPVSLSMSCPHSSIWSFIMLCGFGLAAAAIWTDRKAEDTAIVQAKSKLPADP